MAPGSTICRSEPLVEISTQRAASGLAVPVDDARDLAELAADLFDHVERGVADGAHRHAR